MESSSFAWSRPAGYFCASSFMEVCCLGVRGLHSAAWITTVPVPASRSRNDWLHLAQGSQLFRMRVRAGRVSQKEGCLCRPHQLTCWPAGLEFTAPTLVRDLCSFPLASKHRCFTPHHPVSFLVQLDSTRKNEVRKRRMVELRWDTSRLRAVSDETPKLETGQRSQKSPQFDWMDKVPEVRMPKVYCG
jgi:hypothetical protein